MKWLQRKNKKRLKRVACPEKLTHLKELVIKSSVRGISQKDLWVSLLASEVQLTKKSVEVLAQMR